MHASTRSRRLGGNPPPSISRPIAKRLTGHPLWLSLGLLCSMISGGCGVSNAEWVVDDDEIAKSHLTWTQFLSRTYREPSTGVFIVDGDTAMENLGHLREFYEDHVEHGQLIIQQNGTGDARWNDIEKMNLTYCVSTAFGSRQAEVTQAMAEAAAAWEAAANVNFTHLPAGDPSCNFGNSDVLFDVNPVNAGAEYLARAFFPGAARAGRSVMIDPSAFETAPPLTLTGVLRHELGHVLGFRHEHSRPEAGKCFEDSNWRALTPYDSSSVMQYPSCNGTGDKSLTLSAQDVAGASALYGTPGSDPSPGMKLVKETGSLTPGQRKPHGPYNVAPGTLLSVNMTGTGRPDLYVRFGEPAATYAFDCRPLLNGANESCTLTVPFGQTKAYVLVHSSGAATYALDIYHVPIPPPGSPTVPRLASFTGSVARDQEVQHVPLMVVAGSTFKVVMKGTGNPNLHVRFGSRPTAADFDCRPYVSGANETCSIRVPYRKDTAYLMVKGGSPGSYTLAASYTSPY